MINVPVRFATLTTEIRFILNKFIEVIINWKGHAKTCPFFVPLINNFVSFNSMSVKFAWNLGKYEDMKKLLALLFPWWYHKFFWKGGGIAKWTKATVCKTVILGSNPSAAYFKDVSYEWTRIYSNKEWKKKRIFGESNQGKIPSPLLRILPFFLKVLFFLFIRVYSCKFVAEILPTNAVGRVVEWQTRRT